MNFEWKKGDKFLLAGRLGLIHDIHPDWEMLPEKERLYVVKWLDGSGCAETHFRLGFFFECERILENN